MLFRSMRHCYELMKVVPPEEIDPANIAMLEDNLRALSGQPQRYGSQRDQDGRRFPIEGPDTVDELRKSVGLPTLVEEDEEIRIFNQKQEEA